MEITFSFVTSGKRLSLNRKGNSKVGEERLNRL